MNKSRLKRVVDADSDMVCGLCRHIEFLRIIAKDTDSLARDW